MSLTDALQAAKEQLTKLRAQEAEQLEKSGLRETVQELTLDNQLLTDERERVRREIDRVTRDLAEVREHKALLEQQIKGARARMARLSAAVIERK